MSLASSDLPVVFKVICFANGKEYRTSIPSWDAMLRLASAQGWNPSGARSCKGEDAPFCDPSLRGLGAFKVLYQPQDMAPSDAKSLAEQLNALLASEQAIDEFSNALLTPKRIREFADFVRNSEGFFFMSNET